MPDPAHILIVEDDNDIRRIFQIILNQHGFRVSVVTTG